MTREPDGTFARLVEQGVRAYQHTQRLKLIGMTVAYIAEAAAIGVSTLDSWRSQKARRIPHDYHVLGRFASVCVKAAPELGEEWVRSLFLAAGMAGYCEQALDEIFEREPRTLHDDIEGADTAESGTEDTSENSMRAAHCGIVPQLPDTYVVRQEYVSELKSRIQAIRDTGGCISIVGMTGIGKTVLMTAIGQDPAVEALFPEGAHWVEADKADDSLDLLRRIATSIGCSLPEGDLTLHDGLHVLQARLEGRHILLLVDDVNDLAMAQALRRLGSTMAIVVTTRRRRVAVASTDAGHDPITIGRMSEEQACELARRTAPVPDAERATADHVLGVLGYHPHAVVTTASAARTLGMSWTEIDAADSIQLGTTEATAICSTGCTAAYGHRWRTTGRTWMQSAVRRWTSCPAYRPSSPSMHH